MTFVMGLGGSSWSKGFVCLSDAVNQLANCRHELLVCFLRPELRVPKRSEARLRDQVDHPRMHSVRMLKQEAVTVHTPTGKVERQLERSVITIGGEAIWPGAPKVAVAMLPRAVSVMLVSTVIAKGLYLLVDGHFFPSRTWSG